MSIQDPISDMFVRIKNASMRKKEEVCFPFSKHKKDILDVMLAEGYISSYRSEKVGSDSFTSLIVSLKYYRGQHVIQTIKRISKPSLRQYSSSSDLSLVNNGLGIAIVSTSKGVMTASTAKSLSVGGELIAEIF